MKRIFSILILIVLLVSCEKNVEFNNPALQGNINNAFWKASNITATKNSNGSINITGNAGLATLVLKTSSVNKGTYLLGTLNQAVNVDYAIIDGTETTNYTSTIVAAPVNLITLTAPGTGYTNGDFVETTGGSGTGLKVNITVSATTGEITSVEINSSGNNYKAGDLITILGGNTNAKISVQNVTKSNGEIVITENTDGTISGNFKFAAVNTDNGSTTICREGVFYKIPVN